MKDNGDIPQKDDVRPTDEGAVSVVDEILNSGGVAHVYTESVDGDDLHLYDYNTHRYVESGWVYVHADDKDIWIPESDIGVIERHYET
jgi:hypothetical protein